MESETFTVVWALMKFDYYVGWAQLVKFFTDSTEVKCTSKKNICDIVNTRLQRMLDKCFLDMYHVKGATHYVADLLYYNPIRKFTSTMLLKITSQIILKSLERYKYISME